VKQQKDPHHESSSDGNRSHEKSKKLGGCRSSLEKQKKDSAQDDSSNPDGPHEKSKKLDPSGSSPAKRNKRSLTRLLPVMIALMESGQKKGALSPRSPSSDDCSYGKSAKYDRSAPFPGNNPKRLPLLGNEQSPALIKVRMKPGLKRLTSLIKHRSFRLSAYFFRNTVQH
jgi:hypothetical protein